MKWFGLLLGILVCLVTCSGCTSPYLPHNAVKYIPELSNREKTVNDNNESQVNNNQEGADTMKNDLLGTPETYFSPNSIRERYDKYIQNSSANEDDPLMDIALETIEMMRPNGNSEDEIQTELKNKFHFSDETIKELLAR